MEKSFYKSWVWDLEDGRADSLFNIQDGHSYGGRVVTMWDAEVILLKVNDSLYVCVCMSVCMWSVMSDPL